MRIGFSITSLLKLQIWISLYIGAIISLQHKPQKCLKAPKYCLLRIKDRNKLV